MRPMVWHEGQGRCGQNMGPILSHKWWVSLPQECGSKCRIWHDMEGQMQASDGVYVLM